MFCFLLQIQYLDYGNSEILDPDDLRLPTEHLLEVPQMCFECVFHNLKSVSSASTDVIT